MFAAITRQVTSINGKPIGPSAGPSFPGLLEAFTSPERLLSRMLEAALALGVGERAGSPGCALAVLVFTRCGSRLWLILCMSSKTLPCRCAVPLCRAVHALHNESAGVHWYVIRSWQPTKPVDRLVG